jgi:hypothetical protein
MRQLLGILIAICWLSCSWRKYPSEKYIIPQKYRDLISSFKTGGTLKFQDDMKNFSTFLIQKIDSSLHDKRGCFINMKESKSISIACHEVANARQGFEDYNIIQCGYKIVAGG